MVNLLELRSEEEVETYIVERTILIVNSLSPSFVISLNLEDTLLLSSRVPIHTLKRFPHISKLKLRSRKRRTKY